MISHIGFLYKLDPAIINRYTSGEPFPHIHLINLIEDEMLREVQSSVFKIKDIYKWKKCVHADQTFQNLVMLQ